MGKPILKPTAYGVFEEGVFVKLQVGNSVLPMNWDTALRIAAKLRVYLRDAQEYVGKARTLDEPDAERSSATARKVVRESAMIVEQGYKVYADGPDVILDVKGSCLTMTPVEARNIALWLLQSGTRVKDRFFPDMAIRINVANLTDKTATDRERDLRRDGTATFI
jgi:hypothetical protein